MLPLRLAQLCLVLPLHLPQLRLVPPLCDGLPLLLRQAPGDGEVVQAQTVEPNRGGQLDSQGFAHSLKQLSIPPQLLRRMRVDVQRQHLCQQLPRDSLRNVLTCDASDSRARQLQQMLDILGHDPQRKLNSAGHHLVVRRQDRLLQRDALLRLRGIRGIHQPKRQIERRGGRNIRPHFPLWQLPLPLREHVHDFPVPNHDPNLERQDRERPLPEQKPALWFLLPQYRAVTPACVHIAPPSFCTTRYYPNRPA